MTALVAVPDRPDTTALAAESSALIAEAEAIVISNAAEYQDAVEFGKGAQGLRKRIVDFFMPHKRRAKAVHDELCKDESLQLTGPDRAVAIVKDKILTWTRAEQKRLDEERRQREELARKLAEERQLQEAIDLEEEGDTEAAAAVLDAPIERPIVHQPPAAAPKVAGVATVKRWTFDPEQLTVDAVIKHIAGIPQAQPLAHPELRNLLAIDTKVARQLITAMKSQFNVPGIPAYESDGISLGSK